MPELPDIALYIAALSPRVIAQPLERTRIVSPFLLRSFEPPIEAAEGRKVADIRRLGKRIVFQMAPAAPDTTEPPLFLVFHLMIAGRFRWLKRGAKLPGKLGLAAFDFTTGTLALTEAGTKKRASLHLAIGETALVVHDPGGLDVLTCDLPAFRANLRLENHTLKRSLTDPRLFSGIGNAYSDEILHAAGMSPIKLTEKLTDDECAQLFNATRETLNRWIARLREDFADRFPGPGDVTAFRPDFAVHGRFGKPCPLCAATVQRIRYAENETNYCPRCQTNGRILADRSLSRLLKTDWPRTIEELERG